MRNRRVLPSYDTSEAKADQGGYEKRRGSRQALQRRVISITIFILVAFIGRRYYSAATDLLPSSATQSEHSRKRACVSFVGDIMLANGAKDYARQAGVASALDAITNVAPIVKGCSYGIGNLEGPITRLKISHDPWERTNPAYSFQMEPTILPELLRDELGLTVLNRANNHLLDRGQQGVRDTDSYLARAGLEWFGKGVNAEEVFKPWVLESTDMRIAVTGFGPTLKSNRFMPNEAHLTEGTLPVTKDTVLVAKNLMDETLSKSAVAQKRNLRVAFVHWGENYGEVTPEMRDQARLLANVGGYNLILGSDGSHSVQPLEFIDQAASGGTMAAVLYNIGNFAFSTPGRFSAHGMAGYGSIVQLHLGLPMNLQIHCTIVDNKRVGYVPRLCSRSESRDLFQGIFDGIAYEEYETSAKVDISQIIPVK